MEDARKVGRGGGEKLEECSKEQGQLAEASEGGLGSEGAVVPMVTMMMMMMKMMTTTTPRSILSVVFNFANIADKSKNEMLTKLP